MTASLSFSNAGITDANDLIALRFIPSPRRTDQKLARFDSNGERDLSAEDCRALALRLLDAAFTLDDHCPLAPYTDNITVKIIDEVGRISGGGVNIPDDTYEVCFRGVVVAIGPMVTPERFGVIPQVGDIIAFSRNAGTIIKVGDKSYL